MHLSLHSFPIVDIRDRDMAGFPGHVVDALRSQGFLAVQGHAATRELMDRAELLTTRLFTEFSPEFLEKHYGRPELLRQRGPAGLFTERAASLSGKDRPPPDVKMFWMSRDETWPDNSKDCPFGLNVWPDEVLPEFRPVMLNLMAAYKEVFTVILDAVTKGYGLPSGKLVRMAHGAETILRSIFYPGYRRLRDQGIEIPPGAQRSAPHGDINALTVLRPRPGLWARLNGRWVKADASDPNMLWLNIGEMIAEVEGIGNDLVPTLHCVGTPPGEHDPDGDALNEEDRVALPEFGHFLRSCELRPGVLYGPRFDQRIVEITQG